MLFSAETGGLSESKSRLFRANTKNLWQEATQLTRTWQQDDYRSCYINPINLWLISHACLHELVDECGLGLGFLGLCLFAFGKGRR